MPKYLIKTDYGVLYGKDGYSVLPPERSEKFERIDENKCFDDEDEAHEAAEDITDHSYKVVEVSGLSLGSTKCPHCGRTEIHQHVIDRKGFVHSTTLSGKGTKE